MRKCCFIIFEILNTKIRTNAIQFLADLQSRLPDYRTTLYWSPQLTANDKQISFYTSDIKGKYIAVVQGIDNNGNTTYASTEFEVK